jgi:hypothetical protein
VLLLSLGWKKATVPPAFPVSQKKNGMPYFSIAIREAKPRDAVMHHPFSGGDGTVVDNIVVRPFSFRKP